MRKSTIAFVSFFIVAIFVFQFSEVKTNTVQPPSVRTGAPSELTCGVSDYDSNTPNSGVGSVSIAFSNAQGLYFRENSYTIVTIHLATGLYLIQFRSGTTLHTEKVIID